MGDIVGTSFTSGPVADTPTPTARDWERLGAFWEPSCRWWEWVGPNPSRFGGYACLTPLHEWVVMAHGEIAKNEESVLETDLPSETAAYAFVRDLHVLSAGAQQ